MREVKARERRSRHHAPRIPAEHRPPVRAGNRQRAVSSEARGCDAARIYGGGESSSQRAVSQCQDTQGYRWVLGCGVPLCKNRLYIADGGWCVSGATSAVSCQQNTRTPIYRNDWCTRIQSVIEGICELHGRREGKRR